MNNATHSDADSAATCDEDAKRAWQTPSLTEVASAKDVAGGGGPDDEGSDGFLS